MYMDVNATRERTAQDSYVSVLVWVLELVKNEFPGVDIVIAMSSGEEYFMRARPNGQQHQISRVPKGTDHHDIPFLQCSRSEAGKLIVTRKK